MEIINVPIAEIKRYENNPRLNFKAVEYVANSIKEFGFLVPLVIDNNNVIVAGDTRIQAAEALGLKTLPCIRADNLTKEQITAFRLADNKTTEFAVWDLDRLEQELNLLESMDMETFGFDLKDVEALNIEGEEAEQEGKGQVINCPKCGFEFSI